MKVKFTKASKNDKFKVTLNLSQLDEYGTFDRTEMYQGQQLYIEVDGVPTIFTVNRSFKTAYTKAFPRTKRLPSMGSHVNAEIGDVYVI